MPDAPRHSCLAQPPLAHPKKKEKHRRKMEVKRITADILVSKLSSVSEQTRTEALCELRLMTKHDADSRPLIAEAGAIPYVCEILYSSSSLSQENACSTLLNLSISSRRALITTHGLLDALSHALHHPSSPAAFQSAAATVFSLLLDEANRPVVGAKRDILYALIKSIAGSHNGNHNNHIHNPRSVKDALKALFGIALYLGNRATLIELGAVPALFSVVMKDNRIGTVEDATAVIAQVAGCEESADAFSKVMGFEVLADLLDTATGSSGRTRENAISGLLNLARNGCGGNVKQVVTGEGILDGIADVIENGSEKGQKKAAELLRFVGDEEGGVRDPRFDSLLNMTSSASRCE